MLSITKSQDTLEAEDQNFTSRTFLDLITPQNSEFDISHKLFIYLEYTPSIFAQYLANSLCSF